ncbi:MAG: sulfatase, partial [bacterium]|nr:sulfatase [bacterium]
METIKRRQFLQKSSMLALGVTAAGEPGKAAAEKTVAPRPRPARAPGKKPQRPNIIHIIVHDLGNSLACLGYPDVQTPNLDALAAEGVRFTNHFCNSTACSPARGCLMTGRYAHANGLISLAHMGIVLPESEQTIVDVMNGAGYETYNFGTQHERARQKNRYKHLDKVECMYVEDMANNMIDFLKHHKPSDGPFYANGGTFDVHQPWNTRLKLGPKPGTHAPIDLGPERRAFQARYKADELTIPPFLPDMPHFRQELRQFYGIISHMDAQIGRILDTLKETGLDQDTLVYFTTDHGIGFPRAKGTLYDPGLTTAMIMRWPGRFKAGLECPHPTSHVDLLPTLMELLDLPIPERVQGRSYAPSLLGRAYSPAECLFMERNFHGDFDPMRAVRTGRHKLIRNFSERPRFRYPWEMKEGDAP